MNYRRYHIDTRPTELPSTKIARFLIMRDRERCLNCGRCAVNCIYHVHERDTEDPRRLGEPESYRCRNCFACIQNCPQNALTMLNNPLFLLLGNEYWKPQMIATIWNEAETAKIPVLGAGYRGPFRGYGFDEIWTDMSEIVRPTRDGIHGREYISTTVEIGRRPSWIKDFSVLPEPAFHEIPVPVLFDANPCDVHLKNITHSILQAAHELGTLALLDIECCDEMVLPFLKSLVLRIPVTAIETIDEHILSHVRFVELKTEAGIAEAESVPEQNAGSSIFTTACLPEREDNETAVKRALFADVKALGKFSMDAIIAAISKVTRLNSRTVIILPLRDSTVPGEMLQELIKAGVDVFKLEADEYGRCNGRFISKALRELHHKLVDARCRDEVTLLVHGGIAAAEHVPKALLCGADAVILDRALLVALGCRVCPKCKLDECPAELGKLAPDKSVNRIRNMTCAWRDQLLEILSAMGIRDVRRLRGEVGRAMFYEDVEKEAYEINLRYLNFSKYLWQAQKQRDSKTKMQQNKS